MLEVKKLAIANCLKTKNTEVYLFGSQPRRSKLQNDQIENMVSQGVSVMIVVAEDGNAGAATVREAAADSGVKVIAYDRLIKSA